MNTALLIHTTYTAAITVPVVWGFLRSLTNRNPDCQFKSLLPIAGFALLELALLLDWATLVIVVSGHTPSLVERHDVTLNVVALTVLVSYALGSTGVVLGRIMQPPDRAR